MQLILVVCVVIGDGAMATWRWVLECASSHADGELE